MLRDKRLEIRLKHKNGAKRVYVRRLTPRKARVKTSQDNKRRARARRFRVAGGAAGESLPRRRVHVSRARAHLSVPEQVGLVAALSMSHRCFNRWRLALGGAHSGLASQPVLRAARRQLCSLPGKVVVATGTGAHLASLTAAIQEGVSALIDKDAFIERVVLPPSLSESAGAPRVGPLPGVLAPSVQEVQVTLGLDKGGDPGTVKIVAAIINQAHTNKSSNTILAGVCPCDDDKYEDLKKMLLTHQPQVVALLREGVLVRGERRPVRLFLAGDYAAQCDMLGHKGASATQLCLYCLSTRSPSAAQRLLDATYGTLQDVVVGRGLRKASYYSTRMLAEGAVPAFGDRGSVERSPLLAIVPGQIVPIPLHATIGIDFRYLRLAIEMVMLCASASQDAARWRQAGAAFALELVEILHDQVRVRPTSFQGGLLIGRDCHTIGDSWAVVCAALKGRVSDGHLAAYEEACTMWNRVRTTLNRASVVPADEVRSFQADTAGMVSLLKSSFPWLSFSPKLHILMCHAPAFLQRFGSIGLYGEQGLEAWHGRYGQNADKYLGATELERATALVRAMALAREAGAEVLARHSPSRRPSAAGAHKATKAGDKRRRENKPQLPACGAEASTAAKARNKWAAGICKEAATTIGAYLLREKSRE